MKRAIVALAGVVSFFAVPLLAQTSASLTGVVSAEGHPLPGTTVTVTSPVLQGSRVTVTGETGAYNFPALPPGDYNISFAFSGMVPHSLTSMLRLSQVTRVDAVMKPAGEIITV